MAEEAKYDCDHCGHSTTAWSDGNPYHRTIGGKKTYAYHPSSDRMLCTGNDVPHLCLKCGAGFKVDTAKPIVRCRKCKSADIVRSFALEGKRCPYCKAGIFIRDPAYVCIS